MTTHDQPKRGPGRPRRETPAPPGHNVPMDTDRWDRLGDAAAAIGSNRTAILNALAAYWLREPGAKQPRRPEVIE